jgi:hypothetical protein
MTYDSTPEKWGKLIGIFGAEHPDVIITHEKLASAEYNTKVQIMFAAGTPPDVFQTWAQYRPSWVKQGMLRDISALLNSSKVVNVSSIFPFLLDAVKVETLIGKGASDVSIVTPCMLIKTRPAKVGYGGYCSRAFLFLVAPRPSSRR